MTVEETFSLFICILQDLGFKNLSCLPMYLADMTSSASLVTFLTALEQVKLKLSSWVKQFKKYIQESYQKLFLRWKHFIGATNITVIADLICENLWRKLQITDILPLQLKCDSLNYTQTETPWLAACWLLEVLETEPGQLYRLPLHWKRAWREVIQWCHICNIILQVMYCLSKGIFVLTSLPIIHTPPKEKQHMACNRVRFEYR